MLLDAQGFNGSILWMVTAFVSIVLAFLTGWILFQLQLNHGNKMRRHSIKKEWNAILADLLMNESVLKERVDLPATFVVELRKPFVRRVLAAELVRTRQSLRGTMADTVVAVYNQLGLVACSERLLNSRKWHRQAKGIQQLSIMGQQQYFNAIYRRVNDPNIWVRNEAQLGMLRLKGTKGLGFLKHLRYSLTEWQQFNLLHQLQLQPSRELPSLGTWLLSKNYSVVVFSIRLCRIYQLFEHSELIEQLQQHPSATVRLAASECLSHWGIAAKEFDVTFLQTLPQTQIA